jgi:ribonuclease H / adenosylcobalamin/alpha-ribazole phosphatase
MYEKKDKLKALKIIKELYKNKNALSVTLTGSYSEHFNINKAGDIDIIIICKKLDKKYFNYCINKLKKIKKEFFDDNLDLIINSTFGPIKFYKKNTIVFHLMIYDLNSHIEHTIKSPFTCYDWERSKIFIGRSLSELSPVFQLQLRDFYEARRSTQDYMTDILNNRISYREYEFKKNKYRLKKKYFVIDEVNKRDFIYHTIKFLLINFIKYEENLNYKIKEKKIDKKFHEINKNNFLLNQFKKLRKFKNNKSKENIKNSKNLAIIFIKNFNKHIKNKFNSNKKVYFVRHKKTSLNKNIFLGQKMNPGIKDKILNIELKKIKLDECISSPSRRCLDTAKLIYKKSNILISNYLKEIDYGNAENLTYKELKVRYPNMIKLWSKGKDPKFPKGESTLDVLKRLNKFKSYLTTKNNLKSKKNILITTHNVVLRTLIGDIFKIQMNKWFNININYADLLEFNVDKKKLRSNIKREKLLKIFPNIYLV